MGKHHCIAGECGIEICKGDMKKTISLLKNSQRLSKNIDYNNTWMSPVQYRIASMCSAWDVSKSKEDIEFSQMNGGRKAKSLGILPDSKAF